MYMFQSDNFFIYLKLFVFYFLTLFKNFRNNIASIEIRFRSMTLLTIEESYKYNTFYLLGNFTVYLKILYNK